MIRTLAIAAIAAIGLSASTPASSKMTVQSGPLAVFQMSPGVHLTVSGGRVGVGASVDALAGVVFGPQDTSVSPGIVAGPFASVNAVFSEGITVTWGGRVGAGGLAPSVDGYVPAGLVTYDRGQSFGARSGVRHGIRLRSVVFGAAVNWYEDGSKVWTGGLELPLFPFPFFHGPVYTVAVPEVASDTTDHPGAAAEAAVLRSR